MRVLVVDSGQMFGQGGGWFLTQSCIDGFRKLGLEVSCLGRNKPKLLTIDSFGSMVANVNPDFVFCPMAQANYGLLAQIVEESLIPVILWCSTEDEDFAFTSQVSSKVALYCCYCKRYTDKHKSFGANAIFLPFGVDETMFFKDRVYPEYKSQLCYVGVPFGHKTKLLLPLVDEYKCCFKFGATLPQDEVCKVYNSATLSLQPATHQDLVAPGEAGCTINTFEVSATKTLIIQRDRPDLHLLYADDEIVTFNGTPEDFEEKIAYYLEHTTEREIIAERAYQRTLSDHLYRHRFQKVLDELPSL